MQIAASATLGSEPNSEVARQTEAPYPGIAYGDNQDKVLVRCKWA